MAGAESPSLADLSSNNGDDSPHRAKKGGGAKRKSRNARNLLTPTGYSSGAEIISQSAFPIPTPDRLGPLTDLLEEDMSELPSRETSGELKRNNVPLLVQCQITNQKIFYIFLIL